MNKLVELFCDVDDFSAVFIPEWEARLINNGEIKRRRVKRMSNAEIMTIIINFHQSHYRDFKNYYLGYVSKYLKEEFPSLLSYTRFIEVMPSVIIPLSSYLTTRLGKPTGIAFVDSTKISVCHIIRAKRNRVFEGVAKHGKGTMGWSFGFKLHLIVNHLGEILSVKIPIDTATGMPRGFGFVEMADRFESFDAIDAIDQTFFEGNVITVKESKPKNQGGGGNRGGNRGGGGGNRRFSGGGGNYNSGASQRPRRPRIDRSGNDRPPADEDFNRL